MKSSTFPNTSCAFRITGFPPFVHPDTEILVLGSMPSVQSLAQGFYYGHPRNRFWTLVGLASGLPVGTWEERRTAVRSLRAGLWDVIASCERQGSLDAAIRAPEPADIAGLLTSHPGIRGILVNGSLAAKLLERHLPEPGVPVVRLPSTSPANASWSLERLAAVWVPALQGKAFGSVSR